MTSLNKTSVDRYQEVGVLWTCDFLRATRFAVRRLGWIQMHQYVWASLIAEHRCVTSRIHWQVVTCLKYPWLSQLYGDSRTSGTPFPKSYADFLSGFCYAYVLECWTDNILFNERFVMFMCLSAGQKIFCLVNVLLCLCAWVLDRQYFV
jgi:hypothetical protein